MSSSSSSEPDVPIVILSGPSGSGKTTIVNRLIADAPVRLVKSVSATTRQPRPGEVHGSDYYFLTADEFRIRREQGAFLECFEVHGTGNWYGTPLSELQRAQSAGGWALLEIDVQGAARVKEKYPDALTMFLRTSSLEDYERRLRGRGTESEETIARRLRNAREELQSADNYDYQVINDDLEQALQEIRRILSLREAETHAR